jgi:hypothetical protein
MKLKLPKVLIDNIQRLGNFGSEYGNFRCMNATPLIARQIGQVYARQTNFNVDGIHQDRLNFILRDHAFVDNIRDMFRDIYDRSFRQSFTVHRVTE